MSTTGNESDRVLIRDSWYCHGRRAMLQLEEHPSRTVGRNIVQKCQLGGATGVLIRPIEGPPISSLGHIKAAAAYTDVAICDAAKPNTNTPTAALSGLAGTRFAK